MRKRPLLLLACVFLTGLAYQKYSWKVLAVLGLLPIVRECWIGRKTKKFWKTAGRSILLLSAFLLGVFHMQREIDFRTAYMSKIIDGSRITVWGELIKLETTEYGNRGILSDCYIDFGEGVLPCNDIMVYTSKSHFHRGEIHKITGKVNQFLSARNEGNFDARMYYQSLKIDFMVEEESSVLLARAKGTIKEALFLLQDKISLAYKSGMSEKAAGFYEAMVLGNKIDLDGHLKELFLLGGISHILAISGLHVSILGRGLYRLMRNRGIGFGVAGISSAVLLVLYCVMVGSSTSTVRAVGMMVIFFLAQWIGRSYDMLNALGGMVCFLLWENPFLIENSGFWFSVTALLGVGVVGKEIWMSLAVTLATLPVTAMAYYEIPLYSPLVNFIALPLLMPVFCFAVIGGLLGAVFPSFGFWKILFFPCQWLLSFYEWICALVSNLPWSSMICGKPDWQQVILYYAFLLGGIYLLRANAKQKIVKRWILATGIVLVCGLCIFYPKEKPFEITFLDVGQGDGIYISAGDGVNCFIDGGSLSVKTVGENRILPFLKAKGIRSVDYWFVSHCDTDHISGLSEIIEKGYKIEHIVLHELCSSEKKGAELIELAEKNGVEVLYMEAGYKVCSRNMEMICLGPIQDDGVAIGKDSNENSLVLQMIWNEPGKEKTYKALFAGDISIGIEEALCQKGVLEDVDLFKANHHGSNYSNSSDLLELIQPEYVVVSCGENNLYGHPGIKAIERMRACGAEIFCTMDGGQITFPLIQ